MSIDFFDEKHKFQDDVWGQIDLNNLERDVIDTPEFQRLFRTSQLGFVNLVYPTANHTRGVHSIGACHVASLLVDHLMKNTQKLYSSNTSKYAPFEISPAEKALIRLGALLHDISHVPLSHDVERKTHKILGANNNDAIKVRSFYGHYDKHDDYDTNPLLYLILFDRERSVLARVLSRYSHEFLDLIQTHKDDERYRHIHQFIQTLSQVDTEVWNPELELLPSLLFHLLTYETLSEAAAPQRWIATGYAEEDHKNWSLGPVGFDVKLHQQWYQPFRHDIIGNTLSADLIDYLKRDSRRLGIEQSIDLHLLNYYVLVRSTNEIQASDDTDTAVMSTPKGHVYRCAIDVDDSKRGTTRTSLVNDVFGLLSNRYVIHEKAVMHRVVQSSTAMLSRAMMLLGDRKPSLQNLVRLGDETHALQSEPLLFQELVESSRPTSGDTPLNCQRLDEARKIFLKLIDRRVYRPLMIIPGDRAARHLPSAGQLGTESSEYFLRTLAAIVESPLYSPFLLFVSACVEKFLQGALGSAIEVCDYASAVVKNDELTEAAMCVVPSRVIISASPYKQLYKDPAVVVALPQWNGRIDELSTKGRCEAAIKSDETLFDLIDASISDADAKYAALWKLYVFVSDGLFYTGLLRKLKGQVGDSANSGLSVEEHERNLRLAQLFVLAALEAICEDWFRRCKSPNELAIPKRREILSARLGTKLSPTEFRILLNLWKAKFEHLQQQDDDPLKGLSTVSISQYVHGDPNLDHTERRCRDIRCKSDTTTQEWSKSTSSNELIAFLRANGVSENAKISQAEFKELSNRFNTAKEVFVDEFPDESVLSSTIDLLWLTDFPIQGRKPKDPVPKEKPKSIQFTLGLLETEVEIQHWLLNNVKRQIKNVRVKRQLEAEIESIVAFILALPLVERKNVCENFYVRLANESQVLMNDIKEGQIMHFLNENWGHLIAENTVTSK